MASSRSLYEVLNVSQQAESVVIDAAYRALMKKYHPDAGEGGAVPRDAAEINEAFAVLKDPSRRAEYDHRLWSKQQKIRLADLNALERPRGSRLFGWTGWTLALILGGAAAALAVARDIIPKVSPAAIAAAAEKDKGRVSPARAAAMKAAAAEEANDLVVHPSSDLIIARVRARVKERYAAGPEEAVAVADVPRRISSSPTLQLRQKKSRKGRAVTGPSAKEKSDFLEREGYIY